MLINYVLLRMEDKPQEKIRQKDLPEVQLLFSEDTWYGRAFYRERKGAVHVLQLNTALILKIGTSLINILPI